MSIQKHIGKTTSGDNNKMSVSLHEYNMSTHDLSTIVRNTQSPGTLVPNLCLVGQKGDTFDIDVDSNVLTHPTTGPLFGSFKLEHHIYAAPVRLYNSWLHNNRTKIGLNMAQVKLPQIKETLNKQYDTITTEEEQWNQVNPSCLLAYLGIRGFANMEGPTTKIVSKNALPILAYYDIFKNYYANTQEENFYIIGNTEELLDKICRVHGEKHPSLYNVQALFHDSLSDLNAHLDKEELVLFPYIYEMVKAKLENTPLPEFHCGSIEAPISVMMAEHDIEGGRYRHIEHLTNGYTAPEDACNSYRLVLQQLKAFEEALHQHIHLENNIVFPRSIKMEAKLRDIVTGKQIGRAHV